MSSGERTLSPVAWNLSPFLWQTFNLHCHKNLQRSDLHHTFIVARLPTHSWKMNLPKLSMIWKNFLPNSEFVYFFIFLSYLFILGLFFFSLFLLLCQNISKLVLFWRCSPNDTSDIWVFLTDRSVVAPASAEPGDGWIGKNKLKNKIKKKDKEKRVKQKKKIT